MVVLSADPLQDIRHTREISAVVKGGVLHHRPGGLVGAGRCSAPRTRRPIKTGQN
jgi:hypothetical protein